jgi:type IV pilus assembly protein PilQ
MPLYAKDSGDTAKAPVITGIELLDNAILVTASGPVSYRVHKSEDPFRIVVDIDGMGIGRFREKIFSDKAGITEIELVQVQTPTLAARLNILFQAPSSVSPEVKGNVLALRIRENTRTASVKGDVPEKVVTAVDDPDDGEMDGEGDTATEIAEVLLNKTDEGAELIIKGDGTMPDPDVKEVEGKLIIDFEDMEMKASLPAALFSPLKDLKYRVEEGRLRFVLDLAEGFATRVVAFDDELVVAISSKTAQLKKSAPAQDALKTGGSKDQLAEKGARLISLDFQDADIIAILRLLSDVSGYNIVVHPEVKGKITVKLMNVPWEQALDIILKTFSLEKIVDGNIIRIVTVKAYQDEQKAVADTKEAARKAEDIVTRIFPINYGSVYDMDAKEGKPPITGVKKFITEAKVLSPRGSISVDERTRSVIIKDTPSALMEVQKLLDTIDKPTQQVLIEARIVEVSTNFSKSLGVDWGGGLSSSNRLTTAGGSASSSSVLGGNTSNSSLSNLPARTASSVAPTGAITFGYLNAAQTFGLDMRLSAIETMGKAKLLSTPKIMTLDNEQALIRHGKRIPVTTPGATAGTFTTTYIDANLKLVVTPQVTPGGTVLLKININKDQPDFSSKDNLGNPAIDTREAATQVLVKNNETVVIGGILKGTESNDEANVPMISKIPILGWLFKRDTKESSSEELLIFITPRIIKQ